MSLYLDLLKRVLTRIEFESLTKEEYESRRIGLDWPPPKEAETMIGMVRLTNIEELIYRIMWSSIPGDFCETGVWRGGAAIFMKGCLHHWDYESPVRYTKFRKVWVCDSFQGLPPPNEKDYPVDRGDIHHTHTSLAVSLEEVKRNFQKYQLLDDRVCFVEGWFKDTLPGPIEKLALLRLDGDMYESTIQVLNALYDKVSSGGYVIVDDYALKGAKIATDDFRKQRGITTPLTIIDWTGVYWKKE
jgi:O-methyltransferase